MAPAVLRLAGALVLLAPLAASAANLDVPSDAYPTIQSAIDQAVPGDLIVLAPGVFHERIVITQKDVSIVGAGRDATTIDGDALGTVVTVSGSHAVYVRARIEGVTITNGNGGWGGGVYVHDDAQFDIVDCAIVGNHAGSGGGVAANHNAWPQLTNTLIANNRADYRGGGAMAYVGGIHCDGCVIRDNSAGAEGGGMAGFGYCGGVGAVNSVVTGNTAPVGGGFFAGYDSQCNSSFWVENSVVARNVATVKGGAAALTNGPIVHGYLSHVTVTQNVAPVGAGFLAENNVGFAIQNSIVQGNTTADGLASPPVFLASPAGASYPNGVWSSLVEGGVSLDLAGADTNLDLDPRFADAAAGDYHLTATSPAVDFGSPAASSYLSAPPPADLGGMPRQGSAPDAGAFEYDNSPPVTTATPSGTPGRDGWFTSAVEVLLEAADTGVGVRDLTFALDGGAATVVAGEAAAVTLAADGVHALAFSAVDRNGNAEAPRTVTIPVDTRVPLMLADLDCTGGDLNGVLWCKEPGTLRTWATDATSGVAWVSTAVDDGAPTVVPGAETSVTVGEGRHRVTLGAADVAGNTTVAGIIEVNVDTVPPTVAAAVAGTAGTDGWYRSPVTVTLSVADADSGPRGLSWFVNGASPTTVQGATGTVQVGQTASTVIDFTGIDVAGNLSTTGHLTVRVDATAPALTLAVSPTTIKANGKAQDVRVTGTASDALSGLVGTAVTVTDKAGRVVATTTLGGTVKLMGTKGQAYTVTAVATDRAGNATTRRATVLVK